MEGLKEDTPDFSGTIGFDCRGLVKFADGRSVVINYVEEEYKMRLDEPGRRETWDKGKRFTFFIKSNTVSKILGKEIFNEWGQGIWNIKNVFILWNKY